MAEVHTCRPHIHAFYSPYICTRDYSYTCVLMCTRDSSLLCSEVHVCLAHIHASYYSFICTRDYSFKCTRDYSSISSDVHARFLIVLFWGPRMSHAYLRVLFLIQTYSRLLIHMFWCACEIPHSYVLMCTRVSHISTRRITHSYVLEITHSNVLEITHP